MSFATEFKALLEKHQVRFDLGSNTVTFFPNGRYQDAVLLTSDEQCDTLELAADCLAAIEDGKRLF